MLNLIYMIIEIVALIILLIIFSESYDKLKNYYKEGSDIRPHWLWDFFILLEPEKYIKKEYLAKGYIAFLIKEASLVLSIIILTFMLKNIR